MGRKAHQLEDVWNFIQKGAPDECWPWVRDDKRYGRMTIRRKEFRAHRIVFALTHPGEIDLNVDEFSMESRIVLHSCDNTRCCNPAHLVLGTPQDNVTDMWNKGRGNPQRGASHWSANFTPDVVKGIRTDYASGVTRAELARKHGVSFWSINGIVTGETYKDVA